MHIVQKNRLYDWDLYDKCVWIHPIHQNVKCVWIVIRLCFWKPVITFAILFVNTSNMKLHIHYCMVKNVAYTEKKNNKKLVYGYF